MIAELALLAVLTGGSDSPTPYLVDESGITLPVGRVFGLSDVQDANVRLTDGTTLNIHFPGAPYPADGAAALTWLGLGFGAGDCIEWVQLHGFNEHHGEGGQEPVCVPTVPPVEPPVETPPPTPPAETLPPVTPPVEPPVTPVTPDAPVTETLTATGGPDLGVLAFFGPLLIISGILGRRYWGNPEVKR